MANVVFILGAGASAAGGCPVMSNFLDVARSLALQQPDAGFAKTYAEVQRVQRLLQAANSKAVLDYDNIESVFSAIEMAQLLGGFPTFDESALINARREILRLISQTLDQSQILNLQWGERENFNIMPSGPADYKVFASLVHFLVTCKYQHRVSILTFNYDVGLEIALTSAYVPYTYCLTSEPELIPCAGDTSRLHPVRICKLHGSLSWVASEKDPTRILSFDPYQELQRQANPAHKPSKWRLDTSHARGRLLGLHPDESLPFIVPPGESKSQYRTAIRPVWRHAFEAQQAAEVIAVCGFSLPPTDVFFEQFFALGMINDSIVRNFFVVNKDETAVNRISALLGPNIKHRSGVLRRGSIFREWADEWMTSLALEQNQGFL